LFNGGYTIGRKTEETVHEDAECPHSSFEKIPRGRVPLGQGIGSGVGNKEKLREEKNSINNHVYLENQISQGVIRGKNTGKC